MAIWTLEETLGWYAVDKWPRQEVKHTFRVLNPGGLQSYLSEWVQYPNASIRDQWHQGWSLCFLLAGTCLSCFSTQCIPVLTSSSTNCWNPFCNCGLAAGAKKIDVTLCGKCGKVDVRMYVDANKTLSSSGQITNHFSGHFVQIIHVFWYWRSLHGISPPHTPILPLSVVRPWLH